MTYIDLVFAGDLVLDEPDPDYWLSGIASAIHSADLAIGHLEVPHSRRGTELQGDVPAPGADPAHIAALARAGFDAVSLAGNHITDLGSVGIADTRELLTQSRIAFTGAGANVVEASTAATLAAKGKRVALLSFNCVGPEAAWASDTRAGCAYVRIDTSDGKPIAPSARLERIDESSLAEMQHAIRAARGEVDVVIVALHKGIVHTPATLAPYERPLARAAIDAGCDVVIGHHAHIVRGIEFHRGKPIFHGLGNGCVVTRALSPQQSHPERAAWARKRRELFGFEPDPAYELAPFHPEAINAMLGRVRLFDDGRMRCGFIPVHVEAPGKPVLATGTDATRVIDYVQHITVKAEMEALRVCRDGDHAWLT
ncbi:MAG TPA: CapA family protein [Steroidobacteraceae bacterium]|nr:CapA family protein [Steroidobacteraceae bacterium]